MKCKKSYHIPMLNEEQKKAVAHEKGPLLVIAGAGSGKTRVVTSRIAHLIENGVPAQNILGVTFTNKAAQEMKERVHNLAQKDVLISTFHALGARMLRSSIDALGYSPQFTIYDEDDAEKLLKASVKEALGSNVKVDMKALRFSISTFKNNLILPENAPFSEYTSIYEIYQKKLKEYMACDFDDLIFLPVQILMNHPHILAEYQERWKYILVDEYQDTNKAQYEFVKLIASRYKNLFVVGDPDQSIYSWRGADVSNILNFEKDYPDAKIIRLEENYRSTNTILQAANAVIQNNESRFEKALWSQKGEGQKIQVFEAMSERFEAEYVINTIQKLHAQNISYNDIVIFYRTNFQSRTFEDALLRKKMPYVIVGGLSFYQRKEIKDMLSFLRLLEYPYDIASFLRVINLPKRGLGDAFLTKLVDAASSAQYSLLSYLFHIYSEESSFQLTTKQRQGIGEFIQIITKLQEIKQKNSLVDLVKGAIFETGYLDILKEDKETEQERKENLMELLAKAEEWEKERQNPTLQEFLEEIALATSFDPKTSTESVHLMTVHNGKGLEFEVVFLVGLEEELFPHIHAKKEPKDLEEERRLFYVGITRAKKQLFLLHAQCRHLWGSSRYMRKSRFLKEIPDQFIEKSGVSHFSDTVEKPSPSFTTGDVVFHPQFGVGRIENTMEGSLGITYDILFSNDGKVRKLAAKYSNLSALV